MIPQSFIFSKTMDAFNPSPNPLTNPPNDYNLIHAPADMKDGNS